MDEGEEDYVFYGTPIEREEETSRRKRKAVAEAGQLRSLPAWKQEVIDEEGRRRFHGAFTGGFSAGYYNTVGSKEGWTPQVFTSSRKNRAEVKQQSIYNFLDDDEKAELEGHALETSSQFDTFGFTAAELARKQAEKEHQKRPSAIPGPVPDEIVLPAANSIGVKLLMKMGWRQGHSIEGAHTGALYDARREARKAFLALSGNDERTEGAKLEPSNVDSENLSERHSDGVLGSQSTPVFVLNPKQDLYGLGYDPYKHAPEFRERKNLLSSGNKDRGTKRSTAGKRGLFASNSGKVAPGFGIGALEELDVEDEDIYAYDFEFEEAYVHETEQPSTIDADRKLKLHQMEQNILPGFRAASNSDYSVERFRTPVVPHDFEPHHKFPDLLQFPIKMTDLPPPEVPAPEEKDLKLLIDGFATLVFRCGKLFEDLSREKNKANPLFSFLDGGKGHDYYVRKLWEERQKHADQQKVQLDADSASSTKKMTAESRGRILGERQLERTDNKASSSISVKDVIQLQSNLTETFMKPVSLVGLSESAKPFSDDPAKQERFERFLKDKYQGGLRSTYAGDSNLSEVERARERVDFEAAAEAIAQGESKKTLVQQLPLTSGRQFVSGGVEQNNLPQHEEKTEKTPHPKREEFQWRPSPILCKRFDIIDPFMGKPPPLPRARSKMDSLIFMPDSLRTVKAETAGATKDFSVSSQPAMLDNKDQTMIPETDIQTNDTIVERPVDLYKAIFSDDSDDDGENPVVNPKNDPEKKAEGANTTLNRLIAGDFLESLGKELGLEVPDTPYSSKKSDAAQKETSVRGLSGNERFISTTKASDATMGCLEVSAGEPVQGMGKENQNVPAAVLCESLDNQSGFLRKDYSSGAGVSVHSERKDGTGNTDRHSKRQKTHSRSHSSHHQSTSSSSETDSSSDHKYHRHRRSKAGKDYSSSYTESSDDRRGERSRSRRSKKSSSHRSRKHSKHHRHKSRPSPSCDSSRGTGRDYPDYRKESRSSREHDSRRSHQ